MKTTDPEFLRVMVLQSEKIRVGHLEEIASRFPDEKVPDLTVTGFVFRPATNDDLEEETDDNGYLVDTGNLFVFEAHFFAETHPYIGTVQSNYYFQYDDCTTISEAADRFHREVLLSAETGTTAEA